MHTTSHLLIMFLCLPFAGAAESADPGPRLRVLFLGDNGHHRPADRFDQLATVLEQRGIDLQYTDDMAVLSRATLESFDALLLYANIDTIEPDQARAVLDAVASGKGFVPVHCATYCWRNSPEMVALMGAQFKEHGTGLMSTAVIDTEHPIMRGFGGFECWDETYLHHRHNEEHRSVLEVRNGEPQAEGNTQEPWTWVRTHGKGRIFYTAWGHDARTWGHPGFHNLLERGIRWACGDDPSKAGPYVDLDRFVVPRMTSPRTDVAPFEYVDVGPKIPNYPPSQRWGVQEEPRTLMQKPLPPEESVKHFVTPEGFEVTLWAAEQPASIEQPHDDSPVDRPASGSPRSALGSRRAAGLGGKPIAMNWDERGRLWVCETVDYPNDLHPPGQGRDRIRLCEDTDGDGQADQFTLFAEQLSIPTAILPIHGGVLVQNGTETLFLKDTDGDNRADLRHVLISGWELGDTHGGVSNFQYGLDNWIWAMQGYNTSTPIINGQKQQTFRMGFFRFKIALDGDMPTVTHLEFLRSTNNNTWGLGFSEEGLVFGSTANRCPSVYLPIPNRYYERVRGWSPSQLENIAPDHLFAKPLSDKVRQVDHHGGYTAGAGHALYTARAFPQSWWNRTAFVCGPTGKLVGTFVLTKDEADVRAKTPFNLIASDDEWSAPIMAEVGPDGAVWILDWYNYVVQHNPTPHGFEQGKGNAYLSDLRDKRHGRIYRILYTGDGEVEATSDTAQASALPPDLSVASPAELVQALTRPTMLVRKQAQRLLVERGKTDVVPQLVALIEDPSVDAIGLNVGAIHALWTLHGLGALDAADGSPAVDIVNALAHPSAGVRRNAVQVLPLTTDNVPRVFPLLTDDDAQVRLAAVLALADADHDVDVGRRLAKLARTPAVTRDRWMSDALTSAAATHAIPFLIALSSTDAPAAPVRNAPGEPEPHIARIVAEHVARGRPESQSIEALLAALGRADASLAAAVCGGLSAGWPKDHAIRLSPGADEQLLPLLDRLPAGPRGQLVGLAVRWGSPAMEAYAANIIETLLEAVDDNKLTTDERIEAARQLIGFRETDAAVVVRLLAVITPQASPELAAGLLDALAFSRAEELADLVIARTPSMTPATGRLAIQVLLGRAETTQTLLEALRAGRLHVADLSLEQQRLLASHPDGALRKQAERLLASGGGLPDADRDKVLQQLLPLVQHESDAELGRALYGKHCAKCHQHASVEGVESANIGPNLTGMAVHPRAELLTHIIDPSRSVEGNFRSYTVVTTAGQVLTGMLASETLTSIELVDTGAKRHVIGREEVDEFIASRKSVMPDGFEKQMTPDELAALLTFLTRRGRFLPLDLRKAATIVSTRPMFYGSAPAERLVFDAWGSRTFRDVPFLLVDPQGERQANVVLLHGPQGQHPPRMPRSVSLPVNAAAGRIHLLSGIGGWCFPAHRAETTSLIVRLRYADGQTEDHPLQNGVHFADYIRRVDVPGSEFAFDVAGRQVRYLTITPARPEVPLEELLLVKGDDPTAPLVVAVTIEAAE